MTDVTPTYRRATYPAISPARPSNHQTGRTVLITGSSEGIGFNIAQAYAQANASKVILTSRSQDKLATAAGNLRVGSGEVKTEVLTRVLDASDVSDIERLWAKLAEENIFIDVLILNASAMGHPKSAADVAAVFHFNVAAKLHLVEGFQKQTSNHDRQKILIDVTSAGLQCYPHHNPSYSSSKAGFTNYLCTLADHVPEAEMRIINLHPGCVFTEAARRHSEASRNLPMWDHRELLDMHD